MTRHCDIYKNTKVWPNITIIQVFDGQLACGWEGKQKSSLEWPKALQN